MKTIERFIRISGGIESLEERAFTIFKPPYLPVRVRYAGLGPRDADCIAVAQMIPVKGSERNLESEICFEIRTGEDGLWYWHPISFRQASPAFYHESAWRTAKGQLIRDNAIEEGIAVIATAWDEILVSRGYMSINTLL